MYKKLFTERDEYDDLVAKYLKTKKIDHLSWLHDFRTDQFNEAAKKLRLEATKQDRYSRAMVRVRFLIFMCFCAAHILLILS